MSIEGVKISELPVTEFIQELDDFLIVQNNKNKRVKGRVFHGLTTKLINDLETGGVDKALTAEQGKELKKNIDLKINKDDIVNGLEIGGIDKVLSAEQGKKLSSQITKNANNIADNTKDIERAFETINDNSFLPFEGENIIVEHSKAGFTKDMGIEGMIYQNFSPLKEITIKSGEGERTPVVDMLMPIHPGVKVTISFDLLNNDIQNNTYFRFKTKTGNFINACTISPNDKNKKIIYTVNDEIVSIAPYVQSEDFTNNKGFKIDNLIILIGEHEYIPPYFEGIKSVGEEEGKVSILSCGKNLLNLNAPKSTAGAKLNIIDNNIELVAGSSTVGWLNCTMFYKLKKGCTYTLSFDGVSGTPSNVMVGIKKFKNRVEVGAFGDITSSYTHKTFTLDNADYDEVGFRFFINNATATNLGTSVTFVKPRLYKESDKGIFEEYKEDKKEILLPYGYGHKGFINGAKDVIEVRQDGIYAIQRVNRRILNANEVWNLHSVAPNQTETIAFFLSNICKPSSNLISDKLSAVSSVDFDSNDAESVSSGNSSMFSIMIKINRNKLETQDVEGFKKWLQANPITVYYELATPVEHKIADLNSLNLETYKDITYVFSENEIQPNLSFKAPVDVPATISTLRSANTMLIAQNSDLQAKNQELESVNKKQTKKIIELDDTTSFLVEDALTRKLNN